MKRTFMIMILLLATLVTAQGDVQDAGTTPDSVFYGLDRAMESINLAATFNSAKKAEVHLRHAEERLAELKEMIEEGKTKHIEKLVKDREKSINKSEEKVREAEEKGKNVDELAAKVEEMHAKHIVVLGGLLEKVPEQAREHIQNAIGKSSRSQAIGAITKEKQEEKQAEAQAQISEEKKTKAEDKIKPQEKKTDATEQSQDEKSQKPDATGNLVMQITDKKPESLNITSLEVTISDITVHAAGSGSTVEEVCTIENITEEVCINETIPEIVTVCVNETTIEENCSIVIINNTNTTLCVNETIINEVCTNETINNSVESCENITNSIETCETEGSPGEGWFTIVEGPVTYDLIQIKDVKEFLGSKELGAGKYTQIRLYIDSTKLMISGEEEPLKIPSGKLKLVKNFNIVDGETTTLTLDFDAEKSVHQAGSRYIMKPTIKVIQE